GAIEQLARGSGRQTGTQLVLAGRTSEVSTVRKPEGRQRAGRLSRVTNMVAGMAEESVDDEAAADGALHFSMPGAAGLAKDRAVRQWAEMARAVIGVIEIAMNIGKDELRI